MLEYAITESQCFVPVEGWVTVGFPTPKLTSSFAEFYHTLCVTFPPQEHLSKIMILYGTLWMIEPTCILIIYVVLLPVDRGVITQGAHYFVTLLILQCTYPFSNCHVCVY